MRLREENAFRAYETVSPLSPFLFPVSVDRTVARKSRFARPLSPITIIARCLVDVGRLNVRMDLAALVPGETQRWRCTYPHERASRATGKEERSPSREEWSGVELERSGAWRRGEARRGEARRREERGRLRDARVACSFRSTARRPTCLYPRLLARLPLGGGNTGRCLAGHGRRSNSELLSTGVGIFVPCWRRTRDEFNSDWSLSITSSLGTLFSSPPVHPPSSNAAAS